MRIIPRFYILAIFRLVLLACFSGCKQQTEIKEPVVLNVPLIQEPSWLDPAFAWDTYSSEVLQQIYEGLTYYDPKTQMIKPLLAKNWDFPDDGLSVVVHLRTDVYFHDDLCFPEGRGRKFTAADVKFSWERNALEPSLGDKPTGWRSLEPFAGVHFSANPDSARIDGIVILNDSTLMIELLSPTPWLPEFLTYSFLLIVPEEAVKKYRGNLSSNPVGTGPFRIHNWTPGEDIVLMKNNRYWGSSPKKEILPFIDKLHIRFISDHKKMFTEFRKGNLDMFPLDEDISQFIRKQDRTLKIDTISINISETDISLHTIFLLIPHPYGLSPVPTPAGRLIKNSRILRQALNYAVNKKRIANEVYPLGNAIPAKGRFPPGVPYYRNDLEGYPFNPELSRKLLTHIGYPDGNGLPPFQCVVANTPSNIKLIELVREDFAQIGVTLIPHYVPYSEIRSARVSINPEFELNGWIGDYPHPHNFLDFPFPEPFMGEHSENDLREYYQQWEDDFIRKAPYIFLVHISPPPWILRRKIENFYLHPSGHISFREVKVISE